jgi:hypothetical protein
MAIRFRRSMILACAAAFFGCPASAEQIEAWRVFVADHSEPVVRAIDLRNGDEIARFAIAGAARLHRSQSGRMVYAVQRDANRVQMIDTGIALGDHGDHGDITIEAPAMLDAILAGPPPFSTMRALPGWWLSMPHSREPESRKRSPAAQRITA